MAQRLPHHLFSYAEYLSLERESAIRHEWSAGQVFAMAGGTPEHARLSLRVGAALLAEVNAHGCDVFSSDLKVRILATGLATYPDSTVVCGPIAKTDDDQHAITNPSLLVEVLSQSTEAYDRGEKLWHYQQIPSLRAVLFVSQDVRRLELVERADDGSWSRRAIEGDGALAITSLCATLTLDAVYGGERG